MKVITRYPVINRTTSSQVFSGIDGNSRPDLISLFQRWLYEKKYIEIAQDGEWNRDTKRAWKKYGSEFNKQYNLPEEKKDKFFDKVKNLFGKNTGEETTTPETTEPATEEPVTVQAPVVVDEHDNAIPAITPAKKEGRGITTGDVALIGLGLFIIYQVFFAKDRVTVKIHQQA